MSAFDGDFGGRRRKESLFNGAGSSIHHAEAASTMHTKLANTGHARLLNLVVGVRRAPEPAASHRASKASLKKHPLMKNFTRKADHIKATQKPQIL